LQHSPHCTPGSQCGTLLLAQHLACSHLYRFGVSPAVPPHQNITVALRRLSGDHRHYMPMSENKTLNILASSGTTSIPQASNFYPCAQASTTAKSKVLLLFAFLRFNTVAAYWETERDRMRSQTIAAILEVHRQSMAEVAGHSISEGARDREAVMKKIEKDLGAISDAYREEMLADAGCEAPTTWVMPATSSTATYTILMRQISSAWAATGWIALFGILALLILGYLFLAAYRKGFEAGVRYHQAEMAPRVGAFQGRAYQLDPPPPAAPAPPAGGQLAATGVAAQGVKRSLSAEDAAGVETPPTKAAPDVPQDELPPVESEVVQEGPDEEKVAPEATQPMREEETAPAEAESEGEPTKM